MNIYQTVTDRIVLSLENRVIPWRRTWASGIPKSLGSGREYRGVNILILDNAGFRSRYWLSHQEAMNRGGRVRKDERATPAFFWKWYSPEELAEHRPQTGKPKLAPCKLITSAVFNLDQLEGIRRPTDDVPIRSNQRLMTADLTYDVMPDKPPVYHMRTKDPAYSPSRDHIVMPHLSQFDSAEEYYATLFHELVHATGHKKRLNRFGKISEDRFASYSFEELVAEFGAAFLCAFAGIASPKIESDQASYMAGWIKAIEKDVSMVIRAASAAQKAVDFIRGKLPSDGVNDSESSMGLKLVRNDQPSAEA